jgi:NADPH:quinone reductase
MTAYGPPEVLHPFDLPDPVPGSGEVVIRMVASAVNRADCEIRSGKWPILHRQPFPYIPGLETCGIVETVGPGAVIPVGTKVVTMMQRLGGIHGVRPGGYQERVTVQANSLAVVPDHQDLIQLASVGLAGVTAWHGLRELKLSPGSRILITGASGGVGSVAVRLAKYQKAYVVAPVRNGSKTDFLMELGVDEIWDLSQRPLGDWARERVDGVLEMVGGGTFREAVSALKPRGRLCSVGAISGGEAQLSVWDLLHGLVLTGWSSEDLTSTDLQKAVDELVSLLEAGFLKPPPTRTYRLKEAAQAHEDLESGESVGRLLLLGKS